MSPSRRTGACRCSASRAARGGAIRRPAEKVVRDRAGGALTVTARTRKAGRATIVVTAQGAPGAETAIRRTLTLR